MEQETFTLNGVDYSTEIISEEAKYYLGQIKDLQSQGERLRANLHQVDVATDGFTNLLENALEKGEEDLNAEKEE